MSDYTELKATLEREIEGWVRAGPTWKTGEYMTDALAAITALQAEVAQLRCGAPFDQHHPMSEPTELEMVAWRDEEIGRAHV